jgi:hypothetical protein
MTSTGGLRAAALPVVAAAMVSGVLGLQLAHGGGDFTPLRLANPCAVRTVNSVSTGIEALTERLVILGLDDAACHLGLSREALTLQLAEQGTPTDEEIAALQAGLLTAVDRMKANGTLPPASDLVNEALDESNLNGFLKSAIRLLPDSLINGALKTDDILKRAINELDLQALLANLSNPDDLTPQITKAVTSAVVDSVIARLRSLI